jgi:hypothetical protein
VEYGVIHMEIFSNETREKLQSLPDENRKRVIDGLAKLLAVRPKKYLELQHNPKSRDEIN